MKSWLTKKLPYEYQEDQLILKIFKERNSTTIESSNHKGDENKWTTVVCEERVYG